MLRSLDSITIHGKTMKVFMVFPPQTHEIVHNFEEKYAFNREGWANSA